MSRKRYICVKDTVKSKVGDIIFASKTTGLGEENGTDQIDCYKRYANGLAIIHYPANVENNKSWLLLDDSLETKDFLIHLFINERKKSTFLKSFIFSTGMILFVAVIVGLILIIT